MLKNEVYVQMPVYLKKGSKQHSTEDANTSQLITKIRSIVESMNGRLKQWRFFDKVVSNHYIPHLGEFLRIIAAISNKYRTLPASSQCDKVKENLLKVTTQSRHCKSTFHTSI